MLKKLLKYDLKAVFSIWWILALSLVAVSVVFSFVLKLFEKADGILVIIPIFSLLAYYFGIVIFSVGSMLLVYIRFYKNFFSDEGYLTFTLPVRRSELFLSKFITGYITQVATVIVLIIALGAIIITLPYDEIFSGSGDLFADINNIPGGNWFVPIAIVLACIVLVSPALSLLFVYLCITIGAVIAKRYKVLAAIGIYYGASMLLSIAQTVVTFVIEAVLTELTYSTNVLSNVDPFLAIFLILLIAFLVVLGVTVGIYFLNLRFIKKKLNLP